MTKTLWVTLIVLIALLQVRLWSSEGGIPQVWQLSALIDQQKTENEKLNVRNSTLAATAKSLSDVGDAVEGLARKNLGMIRSDETLFLVVSATDEHLVETAPARPEKPPLDGVWSFPPMKDKVMHLDNADDSTPEFKDG